MRSLILLLLSLFVVSVHAEPMQAFKFDSTEQEEVFKRLSHEIRCLVCQNQSIGDSNAGLAKDLRQEIYDMLRQGKSEDEIVDFLVQRYGDFVLYDPPMKPITWMLWFGPLIMFFIAVYFAINFVRSNQSARTAEAITAEDSDRLKALQSEAREVTGDSRQEK